MARSYWFSQCCDALGDSRLKACWNCDQPRNRARSAKVTVEHCDVCRSDFKTIGNETPCPYTLAVDGPHQAYPCAYYPPNIPPYYWLAVNGLRWDAATERIVPLGGS